MSTPVMLLAGILYVFTLFSGLSVSFGGIVLLFGRPPKKQLLKGWLACLLILVISVLGLVALGFPGS